MKKKTKIIVISVVSILVLVALITVLVIVIRNNQLIDKGNKLYGTSACNKDSHWTGNFGPYSLQITPPAYIECRICHEKKYRNRNILCDRCANLTGRCPECGGLIK